ncbi:DedA family protein [Nocardioides pyridinolyticus]
MYSLTTTGDDLGTVGQLVVDVMEAIGGPGVGILIAAESVFPPLPSELVLPLAGFAASQGHLSLASALIWSTVGSLAGALLLYEIGARLGRDRTFALWRRLPLVEDRDFVRTEEWFARHGRKAVFLGRMLPIFRSLISVPAGVQRMPLPTFVVLTTIGSAIWNTTFILGGYLLGHEWHRVEAAAGWLQWVVLAAVGGAFAWWVVRRLRSRRAGGSSASP